MDKVARVVSKGLHSLSDSCVEEDAYCSHSQCLDGGSFDVECVDPKLCQQSYDCVGKFGCHHLSEVTR